MSAVKLPKGWDCTLLGHVIELKYGKSLSAQTRDGVGFDVYGSNGVVGKHSIPLINHSGLIVGRKGSFGVVQKSTEPFFPIDTTYYIDDFYNQPLEYWFYYLSFLPLTKLNRSTAIPGLNRDDAYNLDIVLPPITEQKIIAEKLDTLLAQVDSTKARLEQVLQILKRFRQAVLAAAVNGLLTKEYRNALSSNLTQNVTEAIEKERIKKNIKSSKLSKEPYPASIPFLIPDSWQWFRLGHISLKITDGAHNTPKVLSEGYPYVMAKDLTKGKLDFSEKRYISVKDHVELYSKCIPDVGDLLVVNIGAGTGNNVLVDVDFEFSFKNIAIIKKSELIVSAYLKIFFDAQKNKIFKEQTKGGAQPFLSLSVLNDIPFALPTVLEQQEIVRQVEQLFAYADTIEKQVNNALARVNNLTQSILAKAFCGELTAQWRAENPDLISGENSAAALLEKIKAERAASSSKKASRKKK